VRPACRGLLAAAWLLAFPALAAAQEPRSAIPWLSRSLEEAPAAFEPAAGPEPPAPLGAEAITVTPLGDVSRGAVGLLPPAVTGFRRDLWGPATAEEVRAAILEHPGGGVPEAKALFLRLLLAEADAPAGGGDEVLVARLDRLLEMGALEQAAALIELSGANRPELFRRWFDIGLLTNDAEPACAALRKNPSLSATLPARVFCLARGGDWNAAEITLTLGEEVGSISAEQQPLLARFLDPELFEGEPNPAVPDPLTPLDFLMREAVGLPRPASPLPLAFLHQDLGEHVPMRVRVGAAERLALAGTLEPERLHEAYTAGEPAASGGVWDRAAAVQALDAALDEGDPKRISRRLAAADEALSGRGLRVALARHYALRLSVLEPEDFGRQARERIFELLVLGGEQRRAAAFAPRRPDARQAAVLELVAGAPADPAPASGDRQDPLAAAATEAFAAAAPEGGREEQLSTMVEEGRQGEAILEALDLLSGGTDIAPSSLRTALYGLRLARQERAARIIAAQTLLGAEPR
jgi:hypothetical protein